MVAALRLQVCNYRIDMSSAFILFIMFACSSPGDLFAVVLSLHLACADSVQCLQFIFHK